jgi:peptidoglycan hydrolase-like protein with peptidoglycan-binding domain
MQKMAHPSWGPGWPADNSHKIVTAVVGEIRLPVRREIAPLVAGLVKGLADARNKKFNPGWCWGYANRAISGTNTPSNHSWGLAVDLDAPENPYLAASTHRAAHPLRKTYPGGRVLRSTMPMKTEAIAKRWGFRWGGVYTTKPDPMHFEFIGSTSDAKKLVAGSGMPMPDKLKKPGRPTIKEGSRGRAVSYLQRKLKIEADGVFGPLTEQAVKAFQRQKNLTVDGIVGEKTWAALRKL